MRIPQKSSNNGLFYGVLAGLALSVVSRLAGQTDLALFLALGSTLVALFGIRSAAAVQVGAVSSDEIQQLLREFRTIPTLLGNVRVEFTPSREPVQKWLKSLPENTRQPVEAFLERATHRIKDAQTIQPGGESTPVVTLKTPEKLADGKAPLTTEAAQKSSGSLTPLPQETPSLRIDTILVDDEESVHLSWKVAAGKAGKTVLTFRTVEEILALPGLSRIPPDTRFVVAAHLARGVRGVQAAKVLFDRGFKNLLLAYPPNQKTVDHPPTWIRRIIDKTPQF
jgi:hypothetical protein